MIVISSALIDAHYYILYLEEFMQRERMKWDKETLQRAEEFYRRYCKMEGGNLVNK